MFDVEVSVAAVVAFVTFLFALSFVKHVFRRQKMPPGPFPLPIIGNLWQLRPGNSVQDLLKLNEKYGPVFTVYFGSRCNVVVTGYQAVKELLIDHGDSVLSRGEIPVFFAVLENKGMSLINGDQWKQLRHFSLLTLRDFGMGKKNLEEPIQAEAQHLVTYFQNLKQQPLNPADVMTCASSNLLSAILMDMRHEYEDKKWMKHIHNMHKGFGIYASFWGQLYDMFPSLMKRLPGPHQKIFKYLQGLRDELMEKVNTHFDSLDPANPRDYVDCFLIRMKQEQEKNDQTPFEISNLFPTVYDMFLGGAETTAITLRFGFLILAKYPDVQEKLHAETDQIIGHTREPSVEDRNNMPYLNAFIHETQRYSDALPLGVARKSTRDVNFRGYLIPKGTDIMPLLTTVLHDPSQFETPNVFNINHFLDENGKFKKNNAFMPFAVGKRSCIGESLVRMELFIFFATILQKFKLKPTVDPKDLDISPAESGFESLPPAHRIIFIPRAQEN